LLKAVAGGLKMKVMHFLFTLNRTHKRIISMMVDFLLLLIAFGFALLARLDSLELLTDMNYWLLATISCSLSIVAFINLNLYRAVFRYMELQTLTAILLGVFASSVAFVIVSYYLQIFLPRTVPFIYTVFAVALVGGYRAVFRSFVDSGMKKRGELVIIYGAGASGRQVVTGLEQSSSYCPLAFVDEDPLLHNTVIQGIPVYSANKLGELVQKNAVRKILLALPSVSLVRRQQILKALEPLSVQVLTLPSMVDLVSGNKQFTDIKEVDIDDLLGRTPVVPYPKLMTTNIKGKVVMVTGAGGSIGSELCRQILKQSPEKIILFDSSEFALYSIESELNEQANSPTIIPIIGSVQNEKRMKSVMESFNVQTVYHAAAYKHVPLVEQNVVEGVRNNILGTLSTAGAAIATKVETFVLISTDKAVRPTNVMGATKRMAELVLQALAKEQHRTRFCMVRFGNVLDSSGSVVPLFRKQIASGGPVTVTHPEITRYFMTIAEASQLVIQAGAMGKGGDVFVLDMGKLVKISDLATKMINLSGYKVINNENPDGDIAIKYTGLRPGEKLYEELLIGGDVTGTYHDRIMTANEIMLPWAKLKPIIERLSVACEQLNQEAIRSILLNAPIGFNPTDGIGDLVHGENDAEHEHNKVIHLRAKAN
jgi:FlaA1/EpsC-like NDP-sugar epimerase